MKKSKRYASWLVAAAVTGALAGCGKQIPSDIIQPAEMENLLYDYHLGTTLQGELPHTESYKKEAYAEYVFRKHGVTEAEFDSSMVWYSRHGEELAAIYDNLLKRFEADGKQVRKFADRRSGQTSLTLFRDTVDMPSLYWLSSSELTNKVTFELRADTSFRPHDGMTWEADFLFMPQARQKAKAVMGLNFTFDNDSTQGITRVITSSGTQRLTLRADSAYKFKTINGFIYYDSDLASEGSVLINGISLTRNHNGSASVAPASKPADDEAEAPEVKNRKVRTASPR